MSPRRRKGLGSRLIERGLAEFRGQAKIAYQHQGVMCTIDAPVEAVRDDRVGAV